MAAFDLAVIGGGPGGYTAAIRAAQLGYEVAIVEAERLGGTCLNWGCIPTKSLLHAADVLRDISDAADWGIDIGGPKIDLERMVGRSRAAADQLAGGVDYLMKKNGIKVLNGAGILTSGRSFTVAGVAHDSEFIILATGARSRDLPHIRIDGDRVWGPREAMTPAFQPERLLIIGAGAIGVEFASFYSAIGSSVTLVEAVDQILPVEDTEVAAGLAQSFSKRGIDVRTGTLVTSMMRDGDVLVAEIGEEIVEFDAAILSVGVTGNVENLGLDGTNVHVEGGFVRTNAFGQTDEPTIYAIGDVAGAPCLAHKASHEGVIAVEAIDGMGPHPLDTRRIPGCTYAYPQVASIGLTEKAAAEAGIATRIGRFPLLANGKAIASGTPEGMIKVIFDAASGELVGAHMLGAGVTELIQGYAIAMGLEATEHDLMATVFPHPTLSEGMHEAVLAAYDRALNF